MVPEDDVARIRRWAQGQVPEHVRDQLRIDIDVSDRAVTVVECRPPWRSTAGTEWTRFPVARLRYTKAARVWSLYWRDSNERFHLYDQLPPSRSVQKLLDEIDADPTALFWG